jgi:glutaminase
MTDWISTGHLPAEAVVKEGTLATYIPALADADPDRFAIAVASTGGQLFEAGETGHAFSIQSLSKPFLYALICEALGEREARQKRG